MKTWEIVILTAICSLIASIVTALITLYVTQKNEVKKHILKERTDLYLEFYPIVDELICSPALVFYDKYMKELIPYKADMKLLASEKTYDKFKDFFDFIILPYNLYDIYLAKKDTKKEYKYDAENYAKFDLKDLDLTKEQFFEKHLPDRQKMSEMTTCLYESMRKDLGSNVK